MSFEREVHREDERMNQRSLHHVERAEAVRFERLPSERREQRLGAHGR